MKPCLKECKVTFFQFLIPIAIVRFGKGEKCTCNLTVVLKYLVETTARLVGSSKVIQK
jgi:hypothetical protein